jgi:hypothetical protein
MFSITKEQTDTIVKTPGNIASHNLSQSFTIHTNPAQYNGNILLFIIPKCPFQH